MDDTDTGNKSSLHWKEVLVIFGSRRRPVRFKCSFDSSEADQFQSLMDTVENNFNDILATEEGSLNSVSGFYLQTVSKEWGGLIDVTASTQIEDHQIITLCRNCSDANLVKPNVEVDANTKEVSPKSCK